MKSTPPQKAKKTIQSENQFPVAGIGASAGGLDAFQKLLKAIPEDSGMAYVLVQHLDPNHESLLPEILQKVTSIPVLEISNDIKVQPNHIYVIPSNKMMMATDGVLKLIARPPKSDKELNLPIDLFFTSLAEVHQSHAIGVVLSGTGSDGTKGLKIIKDHGGITFAQDEASASYDGMPRSAIQANVVDFILPPEEIPQKLLEIVFKIHKSDEELQNPPQQDEDVFRQIISLLRIRKGTDFTHYKQTTVRRRILRRMALSKVEAPADYLETIRKNKPEQDILYQDLLIPVTAFFRDTDTFDNIRDTVFPQIMKHKAPGETIRVWVAGCSTGEEAYSYAMCFKEILEDNRRVQIFASDLSEPAITKARSGIFTKREVESLTPQQLQEFFTKSNGHYHVHKNVRDMCVFAVHNFLKDPPFGKMDFISCRNVLIYMEPYLQKKALTTFHYSLNPKGYLLLGKTESIIGVPDLFATVEKKEKIFTRKDVPSKFMHAASKRSEQNLSHADEDPANETTRTDFQKTADDIMLRKYTPAGVVVDEEMDIVHFRGKTGKFLEQSSGKPSHNLLQMAKSGLAFELRSILHKVKKQKVVVIKENIPLKINGSLQHISIEALPLPNMAEPHYLIVFHEQQSLDNTQALTQSKITSRNKAKNDSKDLRIKQLEQELEQTREDMHSITEDQEAANEELQSANEELLSSSEELQSLNEELETGKEELQSTNEELMVVNQEVISLNEYVTEARDYSEAIVANIREPLLVLNKNLHVRTANHAFYKTFRVNEPETEGVLIYDLGNKQWNIPALKELLEKILPEKSKFSDFEVKHTFSSIGERIMLLNAREVINKNSSEKLILLSIEDITERKRAEEVLRKSEEQFRQLVKELPAAVYSCDAEGRIVFYNDAAEKLWGRKPEIGKDLSHSTFRMLKPDGSSFHIDNSLMSIVLKEGRALKSQEVVVERPDGERSILLAYPQPEFSLSGEVKGAVNMLIDVTEQYLSRKKIEESESLFRNLADAMPQKVWTADAAGNWNYFNSCWYEYTGLTFEKLKGWAWEKAVHPDDWEATKQRWLYSLATGENFEIEHRLLNTEGIYKWHLMRGLAQKDRKGKIKMWIGTDTEIQGQQEQKEELEKEVAERTYKLREANTTLEGKNKELEAFAYVSSHDLQEPLRKIRTFTSLILEKENKNLSERGKDYFDRMQLAASRMQTLIEDLLSYSRTNVTERLFEKTDLRLIIEEVKSDLKDAIAVKQAKIEATDLCPVDIIRFQFRQLMHNLIGNALKFSSPDRPPHIVIKSFTTEGKKLDHPKLSPETIYCNISITDNGIGFEKEYSEKIFEVFQRLHSKDEFPGTGIGLAIVKKIVDNHHGYISATSELNKGTRFDIYIPNEKN